MDFFIFMTMFISEKLQGLQNEIPIFDITFK